MPPLLERLGVEAPVVQAGMGGGLSRHELAAAVSEAGGLGTIAVNGGAAIQRELAAARALTGRPLAVNLLLPFARSDWFEAAAAADVVVTFWGQPRRRTGGVWLHQAGSVEEARRARAAGADGVIVQGVEAGGHVRGTTPALALLEEVRVALPADYPLLLAGGIAARGDVEAALAAGAEAAVAGTCFLLAEESRAHPSYKQHLLAAEETILTDLFGAGWPAPHRVVPNAATERWLHPPAALPGRRGRTGSSTGCWLPGRDTRLPRCNSGWSGRSGRGAGCSLRPGRPTMGRRGWWTRERSMQGKPSAASPRCDPPPTSFGSWPVEQRAWWVDPGTMAAVER
jgi:nitronate monooxygenase